MIYIFEYVIYLTIKIKIITYYLSHSILLFQLIKITIKGLQFLCYEIGIYLVKLLWSQIPPWSFTTFRRNVSTLTRVFPWYLMLLLCLSTPYPFPVTMCYAKRALQMPEGVSSGIKKTIFFIKNHVGRILKL